MARFSRQRAILTPPRDAAIAEPLVETQAFLGAKTEPLGDPVAAAAHALLRGPAVARLAVADAAPAPDPGAQEAQLTTPRHHVFVRALADGRSAVALVARRTLSVGMGWALLRAELTRVEAELS